jgi:hypothetical protein
LPFLSEGGNALAEQEGLPRFERIPSQKAALIQSMSWWMGSGDFALSRPDFTLPACGNTVMSSPGRRAFETDQQHQEAVRVMSKGASAFEKRMAASPH